MDGNGRWARERGLPRNEGHRQGSENLREILKAAREANLEYLTLYAFSSENWKRPPAEVKALMLLLRNFLEKHSEELVEQQIRLHVIGRWRELDKSICKRIDKLMERTAGFTQHNLVLALNYGARAELLDAIRGLHRAAQAGEVQLDSLSYEEFASHLHTANMPDPDLLIRTSGETRISNFLLLQCAYSEFYFTPVYWPDFGREQLLQAIEDYRKRERRYGMTGEQLLQPSSTL